MNIYYYELDLAINMARSSYYKDTWFISTVHENALKEHLETNRDDFDRLLYISFKKKAEAIRKGKMKSFDIKIKLVKQVGSTNGI